MAKRKKQLDYFEFHWKKMEEHYFIFCQNQEPTDLHQMRVNIKKLHAQVKLLDRFCGTDKIKSHFKPIRKIFKQAGKIREAQMHLATLAKLNIHKQRINKKLETRKSEETQNLLDGEKKQSKFLLKKFSKIRKKICGVPNKDMESFYGKQLKKINKNLKEDDVTNYLHDTRKRIKTILYLKVLLSASSQEKLGIDYNHLDQIQDRIGEWHDFHLTSDWTENQVFAKKSQLILLDAEREELEKIDQIKDLDYLLKQ